MTTSLSKVSEVFKTFNKLMVGEFKFFELQGRDARNNGWNDSGINKQIVSDFIRIYKPKDSNHDFSFSFAFNNYQSAKTGVIVSFNRGKDSFYAYYSDFDLFRENFKTFLKEVSRVDVKVQKIGELIFSSFSLSTDSLNLGEFFSSLTSELSPLEKQYASCKKEILNLYPKTQKKKIALTEEDLALREKLNSAVTQSLALEKDYKQLIRQKVSQLKEEKPYFSTRLIGKILYPDVKSHTSPPVLASILSSELGCSEVYFFGDEKFSD